MCVDEQQGLDCENLVHAEIRTDPTERAARSRTGVSSDRVFVLTPVVSTFAFRTPKRLES